jgi:hypothetical protein
MASGPAQERAILTSNANRNYANSQVAIPQASSLTQIPNNNIHEAAPISHESFQNDWQMPMGLEESNMAFDLDSFFLGDMAFNLVSHHVPTNLMNELSPVSGPQTWNNDQSSASFPRLSSLASVAQSSPSHFPGRTPQRTSWPGSFEISEAKRAQIGEEINRTVSWVSYGREH